MATMMNDIPGSLAFADAQSFARVGKKSVGSGGFQGVSKTHTLRQKVRQKHVPLGRKSAPKRQKHVPLGKKCVKNTYP